MEHPSTAPFPRWPFMTTERKRRVRDLSVFLAATLAVLGWMGRTSMQFVDARYVHADSFRVMQAGVAVRDSVRAAIDSEWRRSEIQKLDSINLRLQQIICGERVFKGCR